MFTVRLKNNKSFICDSNTSIFEGAKNSGLVLEHSCLAARCRSCKAKVISGLTENRSDDFVLKAEERDQGFVLTCNATPKSDLELDIEDLGEVPFYESRIIPAKIKSLNLLTETVLQLDLILPPNSAFKYNAGQYVNISRGGVKRSYSIACAYKEGSYLTFYIKKYSGGLMSNYWFSEAKVGDLLRLDGPKGSFFFRDREKEDLIFLATGTGIAPVKSIVEDLTSLNKKKSYKKIWIFYGERYEKDLIWNLDKLLDHDNIQLIPVLSKASDSWNGEKGYVQDVLLSKKMDLAKVQVYACGSERMISEASRLLQSNGLDSASFYSDPFIATN